jgi:hypothetical protein
MTAYATSGAYNYTTNRDAIIARSLRIIGAIGQGETPTAAAVTEAAEALNDLVKEWESDGMPLWAIREYVITPTAGVTQYVVADGPLKVFQAWRRDSSSTIPVDSPMIVFTKAEYNMMSAKASAGTPNQLYYDPPGNLNNLGTVSFYPTPDANAVTYQKYYLVGQRPFENFNAASDIPDFPQYWYNAVKWGLADQLSYEYGVGVTEKAQIAKKALFHKEMALSFGIEEGSFYVQPEANNYGTG